MKKVPCPNIISGENVHIHNCQCCGGRQHIPLIAALKYELQSLLVLSNCGTRDASDHEIHERITNFIDWHKIRHNYKEKSNLIVYFMKNQFPH